MPCCPTCACIGYDFECLAVLAPDRYPHFRSWCEGDDIAKRNLVRDLSRMGIEEITKVNPNPVQTAIATNSENERDSESTFLASVPLSGDIIAGLTEFIGADKAAKWVAKKLTGLPNCGCEERRVFLNNLDSKGRKFLEKLISRRSSRK